MKKIVYFLGIVLGIGCVFGAGYAVAEFKPRERINEYVENAPLYSIQYLGYNYEDMQEVNPENLIFIGLDGLEYFKIIPQYYPASIKVYQDDIELGKTLVYTSEIIEPFIVRGNQSDIFPNIKIELTLENGKTTEIKPCMSLKDGSLLVNEDGEVLPYKYK